MNRFKNLYFILLLMLLAQPTALRADDVFYISPFNITPGDTRTMSIILDNDQIVRGFQTDIIMPDGLSLIKDSSGSFAFSLTGRAPAFSVSSNEISDGIVRVLGYSLMSANIEVGKGALLQVQIEASQGFTGGYVQLKNTILADKNDQDVMLSDSQALVGTKAQNTVSVVGGEIQPGEGSSFPLELYNESMMTACQFDVVLPSGLSLDLEKSRKTERWSSTHQLISNDFGNGRVRIMLLSSNNKPFIGNAGAIWNLWINAGNGVSGNQNVRLENIIFSDTKARTYRFSPISFSIEVPSPSISLNEDDNDIVVYENANKNVNVNVARTMIADGGWYTLCLPFDIDDISTTPLKGAEVRQYKSMAGSVMNFEATTSLKAMHAYLVKPTSDIVNPQFKNVTIDPDGDGIVDGADGYEFVGIYTKRNLVTDGTNLFLSVENKFYVPTEYDRTIKALRGFFIAPSAGSGAKMQICIDDETTNIHTLTNGKILTGKVYNLNGQCVGNGMNTMQKGVYIVNGRKYIVK